jgi:hypothetical protein
MLKSIIEHNAVHAKLVQHPKARPVSIRPYRHDRLGATLGDQVGFISRLLRRRKDFGTVADEQKRLAAGSAISSAKYSDPAPGREQPLGHFNDHRRLPRAADGEIADADHRQGQPLSGEPSSFVAVRAKPYRKRIQRGRPRKPPDRSLSGCEHRTVIVLP